MRLKLILQQHRPNQLIPINYQYLISSFIYRTIENSDNDYSKWLHESGFMSGNKKFKLFTFSKLSIKDCSNENLYGTVYIKVKSEKMELIVSMLAEKTVENFIIGLFENQSMKLYDKNVESKFYVKTAEMIPEPNFKEEMVFKTISPIVLSRKTIYNGKESQQYLGPQDEEYFEYFRKNLEEKYLALAQSSASSKLIDNSLLSFAKSPLKSFELTDKSKSKLITIKEGTPEETKVKGYYYTFKIKGDPGAIKLGYESGFGKNTSLGFGCVENIRIQR